MNYKKNKEIFVTIICAVLVAIASVMAAFIAREEIMSHEYKEVPVFDSLDASGYFPLKPGNWWIYEGFVRNAVANEGPLTVENNVRIKMSVEDVIQVGDIKLYIMKGHPRDAAWFLEKEHADKDIVEVTPSKYGYLVASNKIFYIREDKIDSTVDQLKIQDTYPLEEDEIFSIYDLQFEFPLFRGQRFGALSNIIRSDLRYFWYVEDKIVFHGPNEDFVISLPVYHLVYNTFPGYSKISFRPYLGITSYEYHHHGTIAEVNLSLTGYNIR